MLLGIVGKKIKYTMTDNIFSLSLSNIGRGSWNKLIL
jgi:hypothetical protein